METLRVTFKVDKRRHQMVVKGTNSLEVAEKLQKLLGKKVTVVKTERVGDKDGQQEQS